MECIVDYHIFIRFEKTNNYYLQNYNSEKPSKYIMNEDYNSKYLNVMDYSKMSFCYSKLIIDVNLYLKKLDVNKLS